MATIMTKRGSLDNIVTYEHFCDTTEDMINIDSHTITLGSVCIVVNGENDGLEVYIADSNKEWHLLSVNSSESGSDVGVGIHVCGVNEYDANTGEPTVEVPIENTFYLVPSSGSDESNLFDEWIYINEGWEKFGSGGSSVSISQSDWEEEDSSDDEFIKNKPKIKAGEGTNSIIESDFTNNTAEGDYAHSEGSATQANEDYAHAEGYQTIVYPKSFYSHAEGLQSEVGRENATNNIFGAHAEGYGTKALGSGSHSEGRDTEASGAYAHAEGQNTIASGSNAHAEGEYTQATFASSHAEGYYSVTNAQYSHAEGQNTSTSGIASHAEGYYTQANGSYSHSEGQYCKSNRKSQHVFGRYNVLDTTGSNSGDYGKYVEIVGNGAANARSNARTLDWNGNEWLAGNLKLNQTILTEALIQKLIDIQPVSQLNVSGTDLVITATQNTRYICGEVSTLDFTPCVTGICDIRFTSGSSKTILTLPNTVKMPDDFEIEPNMIYEINIMDGVYGVVTSWAV